MVTFGVSYYDAVLKHMNDLTVSLYLHLFISNDQLSLNHIRDKMCNNIENREVLNKSFY